MEPALVVAALLAELQRQVEEPRDDGYVPFVGPRDIPSVVHIEGPIDVEALAEAAIAVLAPEADSPEVAPV
jgi:hypothetical protein